MIFFVSFFFFAFKFPVIKVLNDFSVSELYTYLDIFGMSVAGTWIPQSNEMHYTYIPRFGSVRSIAYLEGEREKNTQKIAFQQNDCVNHAICVPYSLLIHSKFLLRSALLVTIGYVSNDSGTEI